MTLLFDFAPRTRFVHGPGSVDQLGELARELGATRALVVSDPGIVRAGHTQHGLNSLHSADVATQLFDGVAENPTTEHVDAGLSVAREFQPDLIVGLGGGSSMDCAKGINFLLTNGGRMQDYWGMEKAAQPLLPMIAIPTTAGTGSEAQSFALISDATTHVKMACGDKKATFRVAILDPLLTVTQPSMVTALTGIDALSHALESYVTRSRTDVSQMFSREAFRLLSSNLQTVLDDPANVAARGAMQIGACYSGLAIEHSMLGAAHALANPLTAKYGIAHGQAVALMLPHVVRFNAAECETLYAELLTTLDISYRSGQRELAGAYLSGQRKLAGAGGSAALADFVSQQIAAAQVKTQLRDCSVVETDLPELAVQAAKQWTLQHNPRPATEAELLALYQAAW